jgi:flagellar assembly protein FliH
MNPAKRFTFDTEFHADGDRRAPSAQARQKQTLTIEELESLKTLARLEGENGASARLAAAVEALAAQVRAALDESHAEVEALRNEAAGIALAMARKIAPAALAALPAGDVEIALRQAMMIAEDAHMRGGDCRIEWRGGGAERSEQMIEEALTDLIAHRFSNIAEVKG